MADSDDEQPVRNVLYFHLFFIRAYAAIYLVKTNK
jgi:hypothetical protein